MPTASVEATTTILVFSMFFGIERYIYVGFLQFNTQKTWLEIIATVRPLTMKKILECGQNLC